MNDFFTEDITTDIVHVIKKRYIGAVIYKRGKSDNHLCFKIISEDDGSWSVSSEGLSSSWLLEYRSVLEDVSLWMEQNGEVSINKFQRAHGYKLKK